MHSPASKDNARASAPYTSRYPSHRFACPNGSSLCRETIVTPTPERGVARHAPGAHKVSGNNVGKTMSSN